MDLPSFVETVKRHAAHDQAQEELVRTLMELLESHSYGDITDALLRARYRINLGSDDDE